jgi:hypothetical protein
MKIWSVAFYKAVDIPPNPSPGFAADLSRRMHPTLMSVANSTPLMGELIEQTGRRTVALPGRNLLL